MTREYTNRILEMIEEGILDAEDVVRACLAYMPESEVEDMAIINELIMENEDYDDSMDGDFDSAMASCGMGTDEDYGFFGD